MISWEKILELAFEEEISEQAETLPLEPRAKDIVKDLILEQFAKDLKTLVEINQSVICKFQD